MIRNGGTASVGLPILHVRAALPREDKAQSLQDTADLAWLENGGLGHELTPLQ